MVNTHESKERFGDEERLRETPATPDRGHRERFTDEESELLRHLRFGQLPDPVPPAEWVEEVDPDAPYDPPEQPLSAPYA